MHPSIEHRAARFCREHGGGGGGGSGSTKVSIEHVLAGRVDLDDGAISGLVVGFLDEAEDSPRSIDVFVNVDWLGARPARRTLHQHNSGNGGAGGAPSAAEEGIIASVVTTRSSDAERRL